ncbi:MAG: glycosyltransferase family 4 protein [Planctomycetales bacterium]|nr:glycosyltransferase family 4 protein [Planctomycetales bacterium]
MKILYLNSDLGIPVLGGKGAAVHVRSMVSAFGRAGHQVLLAAPLTNKSPWESPAALDGELLHLPPSDETKSAAQVIKQFTSSLGNEAASLSGEVRRILYNQGLEHRLIRKFASHPPDLIYERASLFGTAGVNAAQALGCPHILEMNAPLAMEQSVYRSAALCNLVASAEQWTLRNAGAVVTVSEPLRQYAIDNGADPRRVFVTPNGVDLDMFRPIIGGQADDAAGRSPVLGFVGGLRPWHGVEVLPALLSELLGEFPGLRLVIAGDGPMRRELDDEFQRRGLMDNVVMTGAVPHDEIPQLINQFTIALAPYPELDHDFYFSPLKLFEYLACGKPVVASRVGQIADVIEHGKTGLLPPPGDLAALADCCRLLLKDATLRREMAKRAVEVVQRNYTWDGNARRVLEIAQDLRDDSPDPTTLCTADGMAAT